jgi:hypothetical protein
MTSTYSKANYANINTVKTYNGALPLIYNPNDFTSAGSAYFDSIYDAGNLTVDGITATEGIDDTGSSIFNNLSINGSGLIQGQIISSQNYVNAITVDLQQQIDDNQSALDKLSNAINAVTGGGNSGGSHGINIPGIGTVSLARNVTDVNTSLDSIQTVQTDHENKLTRHQNKLNDHDSQFTSVNSTIQTLAPTNNASFTGTLTSQNFSSSSLVDNGAITFLNDITAGSSNNTNHSLTCYYPAVLNDKLTVSGTSKLDGDVRLGGNNSTNTNTLTINSNSLIVNDCCSSITLPNESINKSSVKNLISSLNSKQDTLIFDSTPTFFSGNSLTSGSIYQALSTKANLSGINSFSGLNDFSSGSLLAPTKTQGNNSTNCATTAYVDTAINNLIGGAPTALNTLSELATAINNNESYASTVTTLLAGKAGLSINNTYTGINDFTSGVIRAETQSQGNSSTKCATTAYVDTGLSSKQNTLIYDTTPTAFSGNSLTSGIIQQALSTKANVNNANFTGTFQTQSFVDNGSATFNNGLTVTAGSVTLPDNALSISKINNLQSRLNDKQDTLIYDSTPTFFSGNSLTSGSIYQALSNKANVNNANFTGTFQTQSFVDNGSATFNNGLTVTAGSVTLPDDAISISKINNLQSRLNDKQDKLIYDSTPTFFSGNSLTSGSIYQALSAKANLSGSNSFTGANDFTSGSISAPTKTQGNNSTNCATTAYVDTAINNLIGGAPTALNTLSELASAINNNESYASTVTTSLAGKAGLSVNNTYTGINDFTGGTLRAETQVQGNNSTKCATTAYVDAGLSTKANSANATFSGTFQTQSFVDNGSATFNNGLTVTAGTVTMPNNALTISNINNLQSTLNGKQATLTFDSTPTSFSGNSLTSGIIYQTLQNYALLGTNNTYTANNDFTGGTTRVSTQTQGDNSTKCASTSYVDSAITSSSLVHTSGVETITGAKTFSGQTTLGNSFLNGTNMVQNMVEYVTNATVSSNALSVTIGTNNSVFFISPSSANNMTLTVNFTNFLSNQLSNSFSFSLTLAFIINTASNKQYINSVIYSGTSYTPIASGGLSNVSVNASSVYALQTITLLFINSTTPTKVMTSISSMY